MFQMVILGAMELVLLLLLLSLWLFVFFFFSVFKCFIGCCHWHGDKEEKEEIWREAQNLQQIFSNVDKYIYYFNVL